MKDYYVYQLRLGTSENPFYIGKGTGRRMHDHLKASSLKKNSHKNKTILKAMRIGIPILAEIIHRNLSENDAFEMEKMEILRQLVGFDVVFCVDH